MLKRSAPLLLLLLVGYIAVQATQVTGEGIAPTECDSYTQDHPSAAVKSLAKKVWRQANGPTDIQRATFENYLSCNTNKTKLLAIWRQAKARYKYDRYLARLNQRCKSNTAVPCIRYASALYHQSYSHAYQVAISESQLRYWICNSSDHCGLYQFDRQTFYDSRNPHGYGSRLNARNNALSAMWFWSIGETSRWAQTF